jgi:hypothetical protein
MQGHPLRNIGYAQLPEAGGYQQVPPTLRQFLDCDPELARTMLIEVLTDIYRLYGQLGAVPAHAVLAGIWRMLEERIALPLASDEQYGAMGPVLAGEARPRGTEDPAHAGPTAREPVATPVPLVTQQTAHGSRPVGARRHVTRR